MGNWLRKGRIFFRVDCRPCRLSPVSIVAGPAQWSVPPRYCEVTGRDLPVFTVDWPWCAHAGRGAFCRLWPYRHNRVVGLLKSAYSIRIFRIPRRFTRIAQPDFSALFPQSVRSCEDS